METARALLACSIGSHKLEMRLMANGHETIVWMHALVSTRYLQRV